VYVGRLTRGLIIFVTISATFWAGVAMGGVMTVDSERQRWWFAAEMLSGVHGIVGWQRHRYVMRRLADEHTEIRSAEGAARQTLVDEALAKERLALVAPTASVARAYAGVAGFLNLMCMFDAMMISMMGIKGEPKPRKPKESETT
jgi:hypothetical protein